MIGSVSYLSALVLMSLFTELVRHWLRTEPDTAVQPCDCTECPEAEVPEARDVSRWIGLTVGASFVSTSFLLVLLHLLLPSNRASF